MKRCLAAAVILQLLTATASADPKPVLPGPDGQKAFDDLAAYYANDAAKPASDQALADLAKGGDSAQHAGQYLLALFEQCLADETNGRAAWKRSPAWGGGSENPAREFRKALAGKFADAAQGNAALPVALWLINEEKLPEGLTAGIAALRKIKSPEADAALGVIITQPNPNEEILVGALDEAGQRDLIGFKPQVILLENSYRTVVRAAASKAAAQLGDHEARAFQPEQAFSPYLAGLMQKFADRVYTPIPVDAQWMEITSASTNPNASPDTARPSFYGWLLRTEGDNVVILDWQGNVGTVPKKSFEMKPATLADTAKKLEKIRASGDRDQLNSLSMRGGLTAQFEPGFISVPEALVAAWSFQRGDKATAAALLFPCFNKTKDDRWVNWAVRDMLGNRYHQQMLDKFSLNRDYAATLQYAQHLSKPLFDGFNYQPRARELAAQLPARMGDFTTFALPTPDDWTKQKATMSRPDQITFLASHLRLLNCIQMMQPGGVSYSDAQYAQSFDSMRNLTAPPKDIVINPYNELRSMSLTPADIEVLLPYAIDQSFMPTYSYWRNFHPGRTLHRVSWAVEDVVNEAAQQTLVDLKDLDALDDEGKKQALEKLKAWCQAHEGKSVADLLAETIRTTKDQNDFLNAARKAITLKQPQLITLAVARAGDFPKATTQLAQLALLSGSPDFVDQARAWLKANPPAQTNDQQQDLMQQMGHGQDSDEIRFWAALILVRDGDHSKDEGLDVLKSFLDRDDGTNYYPRAIPTLLATKNEKLMALACGVLKKPGVLTSSMDEADQLLRLFLAGRAECRDFVLAELKDTTPGKEMMFTTGPDGRTTQGYPPASQNIVEIVCHWRKDIFQIDESMSAAENMKRRRELADWVNAQFALIQQGKTPDMRTELSDAISSWQVDAP